MDKQQFFPLVTTEDLIIKVMHCNLEDKDKADVIKAIVKSEQTFVPYADYPNPVVQPYVTYVAKEGAVCKCSK